MSGRETDTRTVTLVDIPLVRRLSEHGTVLDSELKLTGDARGPRSALLTGLLFPQRGLHTLVARSDKQRVVGQFRYKPEEQNAHIVYIAPQLENDVEDTAWLHILDAMAREAGKNSAQTLVAEVEENCQLFETMRTAGFAVYARQEIWRRDPGEYETYGRVVELHEEVEEDANGVHALLGSTIPSLVQQVAYPPRDMKGYVYRKNERVEAYVAVSAGKQGIYLMPYLHPDIITEAPAVFESVIRQVHSAANLPIYALVRRYQPWLEGALETLAFDPWAQQAVMVRHIAAGVRQASFSPLRRGTKAVTSSLSPPSSQMLSQPSVHLSAEGTHNGSQE